MKRRWIVVPVALAGLACWIGWAASETPRKFFVREAPPAANEPSAVLEVSGTIASVDRKRSAVALRSGWFHSEVFVVDSNTVIRMERSRLRLSDLNAGDSVRVRYLRRSEQNVAREIAIRPKEGQRNSTRG